MPAAAESDAQLVARTLKGNREAFRQIVERHQNLICSLAYSALGNLAQSEDLAQETFVAAWKQLPQLREPLKLRSWLCGIVRCLIGKELRRRGHEPLHAAEPLDQIEETVLIDGSADRAFVARVLFGFGDAVDRLRKDARGGSLAGAARPREEVGVSDASHRQSILERARHVFLAVDLVEGSRPIFEI